MPRERTQSAQMNVMLHDPLDGEQRELPVGRCRRRLPRPRTAIDATHHSFQPAPLYVVVDRLGVDALALQPRGIDHEAGRNALQAGFQTWGPLMVQIVRASCRERGCQYV